MQLCWFTASKDKVDKGKVDMCTVYGCVHICMCVDHDHALVAPEPTQALKTNKAQTEGSKHNQEADHTKPHSRTVSCIFKKLIKVQAPNHRHERAEPEAVSQRLRQQRTHCWAPSTGLGHHSLSSRPIWSHVRPLGWP